MATLLAIIVVVPSCSVAETTSPPNIILVMADDVGYGDLACLGNPIVHTPSLDAFWRDSVRFTDFHVSPTCAPTRAALLTGRHEFKSGVTHTIYERERLSPRAKTLAQVLKSAGYSTGIFGKWHLGDEPDRWPSKRGFDEMFIHGGGGIGQSYPGSCGDAPGNKYFNPALLHNGKFERTNGYCTDVFFQQAQTWIESVRRKGPFFAYIPPNAAHEPLDVDEKYARPYADRVSGKVAKFYGMIKNIDESFGRLMTYLEKAGLSRNTLVIFLTDNGTATGAQVFNAGMRGAKGSVYQGGTRVPSFWRWPAGFEGGHDCGALTAHIDIFRTLADVAGAKLSDEVNQQVEGRDLLPLLENPNVEWPDRTLVVHIGRWSRGEAAKSKYAGCSIRNRCYSLVNNRELYDLKNDPGESQNVLADHADIVQSLRAAYDDWWQSVLPCLENESAIGPKTNPFHDLYYQQFSDGPN